MKSHSKRLVLIVSTLLASCSSGSGSSSNPNKAQAPNGSGEVVINMSGIWRVEDVVVIEANWANPRPPVAGWEYSMTSTGLIALGSKVVSQDILEELLDVRFSWYQNTCDGRFLRFGFGWDELASGGDYQSYGLVGGAVDENTIRVRDYLEYQAGPNDPPILEVYEYSLIRVSTSSGQVP